jgi:hypothetical protein
LKDREVEGGSGDDDEERDECAEFTDKREKMREISLKQEGEGVGRKGTGLWSNRVMVGKALVKITSPS